MKRILIISAIILSISAAFVVGAFFLGENYSSRAVGTQSESTPHPKKIAANNSAAANECNVNADGKTVLVSISKQRMWACEGTKNVEQSDVTTGASDAPNGIDDSTPVGTWHIYQKSLNQHLRGRDKNGSWNDFVKYWMPFDSQVGFHDASWQTFPFGNSLYKTSGSHGCVHIPTATATWLYNWASVGTKVVVKA